MRDYGEFQEVENWGEELEPAEREQSSERSGREGGGFFLPVLQIILCAALLLSLAVLKAADRDTYKKAVSWYRSEAAKEIELPERRRRAPGEEASSAVSETVEFQTGGVLQQI